MLTFDQIKELIGLVADRGLGRVRVERSGFVVEIEAPPSPHPAPAHPAAPAGAAQAGAPSRPPAAGDDGGASAEDAGGDGAEDLGDHTLTSPIVGTFYRAPSPDAEAFVEEGDRVEPGQVLCIVEAMKLMNEIEADVAGTVVRIHPENGEAVEYGAPLFSIQT